MNPLRDGAAPCPAVSGSAALPTAEDGGARSNPTDAAAPSPGALRPRRIASDELLGPAALLLIEHRGELYTLRKTSTGKLILTK